ncbi:MAG TPA: hypothetical protein VG225_10770 [Terracidiphilus sp.]|jgi:hypothetical protein|nr:hypothetical protein [Terracidiphilus sp.]
MAKAQKVSPSTVQRIWSRNDIQPHLNELCDQILAYLAERNANPTRYTWNAKGEDILRKIQQAKHALPV